MNTGTQAGPREAIRSFEQEIKRQEDLMFGVALFFEGLSILYEGQPALIETHRRQFRNIIQTGKETADQARTLLERAKNDPGTLDILKSFDFRICQGHADPDGMARRAAILVAAYGKLFPGRPRDQALTQEEIFSLVESASGDLT